MTDVAAVTQSPITAGNAGSAPRAFAGIFVVVSLVFDLLGWWRLLSYDDISDKFVGGDAYNMQIVALHGIGFIALGIAAAVIAVVFAVLGSRPR